MRLDDPTNHKSVILPEKCHLQIFFPFETCLVDMNFYTQKVLDYTGRNLWEEGFTRGEISIKILILILEKVTIVRGGSEWMAAATKQRRNCRRMSSLLQKESRIGVVG